MEPTYIKCDYLTEVRVPVKVADLGFCTFNLKKTDLGVEILLICIYDKSEKSTVLKADALKKLKQIITEEG
jgi:hypothetical protein